MLVRQAIDTRLSELKHRQEEEVRGRLPWSLRLDHLDVRTAFHRRLSSSRLFALGDRSGVLRTAQRRSGLAFKLDVRQRVVVKALVCRHQGAGALRRAALSRHLNYLGRNGSGVEGAKPPFFDRASDRADPAQITADWGADRHHFRFILSPEHGDRLQDLPGYVREVMGRVAADLGEPQLDWLAVCHFDTDQPHAHVLVRGRRADGRDLVIPRDYIAYGFRARAQEVAQERLGDLSRADAERRVWRETQADRFTSFDRRLLAAADELGVVPNGIGRSGAWPALTRGRLRHLEALGLAEPAPGGYRLAEELELKLRTLQLRRDVIRTLNQRRLEGAREVRQLGLGTVRGRVVHSGYHDELGASPFVVVRDRRGVEHYARLGFGKIAPPRDSEIALQMTDNGASLVGGRSADLSK